MEKSSFGSLTGNVQNVGKGLNGETNIDILDFTTIFVDKESYAVKDLSQKLSIKYF
jgi:hypothetical protein